MVDLVFKIGLFYSCSWSIIFPPSTVKPQKYDTIFPLNRPGRKLENDKNLFGSKDVHIGLEGGGSSKFSQLSIQVKNRIHGS